MFSANYISKIYHTADWAYCLMQILLLVSAYLPLKKLCAINFYLFTLFFFFLPMGHFGDRYFTAGKAHTNFPILISKSLPFSHYYLHLISRLISRQKGWAAGSPRPVVSDSHSDESISNVNTKSDIINHIFLFSQQGIKLFQISGHQIHKCLL